MRSEEEYERVVRERDSLIEALTAKAWADAAYRYHCLRGITDDSCPCCGGRIVVEDNGFATGIRLRAVPWA